MKTHRVPWPILAATELRHVYQRISSNGLFALAENFNSISADRWIYICVCVRACVWTKSQTPHNSIQGIGFTGNCPELVSISPTVWKVAALRPSFFLLSTPPRIKTPAKIAKLSEKRHASLWSNLFFVSFFLFFYFVLRNLEKSKENSIILILQYYLEEDGVFFRCNS